MSDFNTIKELARSYLQDKDLEPLEKAYKFADKVHADQVHPTSGEPYIAHVLAVTEILLTMKLDLQTVISGLLHGVLKQDPSLSVKEIEKDYGNDVANIVRGATRITNVQFNSKLTYQAENIRKLLLAMASDIRFYWSSLLTGCMICVPLYWMIRSNKRNWPRKPWNFTRPLPAVWVSTG